MREQDQIRQNLAQERERLQHELAQMEGSEKDPGGSNLREETGELSVVDNHPADMGSESYEKSKDLALKEKKKYLLERIDAALAKMEEGAYGICEKCGASIAKERLQAVPYALYCLSCQELAEREEAGTAAMERPVEEDLLKNPFVRDRMRDESREDSEDFWQHAARHNKRRRIFEDGLEDEKSSETEPTDKISNREYRDQLPE